MALATKPEQASAKPQKPSAGSTGGKIALVLLVPGLAYLGLFFVTPLISLVMTSLQVPHPSGDIGRYDFGLEFGNYLYAASQYSTQIFRSFLFALAATVIALVISYPLAYFIGVKARRWPLLQGLMLTLVIAPFFISFLLRTFAWKQIFANEGWVSNLLKTLGILGPDDFIVGSAGAVIFGLVYNFIPFMTLPLYTNLERLNTSYLEAGSDLYASPVKTFLKVTLPLSLPGITSGTLLTFIPIAGDYVTASRDFLGGSDTAMLGNVVEVNFFRIQDYPTAAALSVILMSAIVVLVAAYVRRSGTEDLI
jgi:spermidine/putrescine transport system permease protein